MAKEIERKFLVDKDLLLNSAYANCHSAREIGISQGYLFDVKNHIGRIRQTSDGKSRFTYKGPTKGISRTEVEFRIPNVVGKLLMAFCKKKIHKTRLTFPTIEKHHNIANTYWEVDTFHNLDRELMLAEIELPSEDTEFSTPDWLGKEVSDDPFYYNSNLVRIAK